MSGLKLQDSVDHDLAIAVKHAAEQVHASLLDNINTGGAVEALLELVAATNKYMKLREEATAAGSTGDCTGGLPSCISVKGPEALES